MATLVTNQVIDTRTAIQLTHRVNTFYLLKYQAESPSVIALSLLIHGRAPLLWDIIRLRDQDGFGSTLFTKPQKGLEAKIGQPNYRLLVALTDVVDANTNIKNEIWAETQNYNASSIPAYFPNRPKNSHEQKEMLSSLRLFRSGSPQWNLTLENINAFLRMA